jgi:hypothetical protein
MVFKNFCLIVKIKNNIKLYDFLKVYNWLLYLCNMLWNIRLFLILIKFLNSINRRFILFYIYCRHYPYFIPLEPIKFIPLFHYTMQKYSKIVWFTDKTNSSQTKDLYATRFTEKICIRYSLNTKCIIVKVIWKYFL